jgi:hypothetical protein
MKAETQKVSPEVALSWLERSGGNRAMRSDHIASLAAQMRRGEWVMNGSSIVFDAKGQLLDGHHRLMACHISGVSVEFLVVRGADTGALFTIDTGRSRTLADHLSMHGGNNTAQRASYIAACVRVVVGQAVPLRTVDAYRAWEPTFREGTEAFFGMSLHLAKFLRAASVAAPLIVAFKAAPEVMPAVYLALRDGTELKGGSPIHTLREWLLGMNAARIPRDSAEMVAAKVFAALNAHIDGRGLKKLQASLDSLDWFRKLYARGTAGKLIAEAKAMRNASRKVVEVLVPGQVKS